MPSPYRKQRLAEVQDGKRAWAVGDDAGGDHDVFYTEFVAPLRELKYDGIFDTLNETTFAINGDVRIALLEIIGGINYHNEDGDGE